MPTLVGELTWVGDEARSISNVVEEVFDDLLQSFVLEW